MSNLKGKAAIVTGASKGIGAGIAKALGAAGCRGTAAGTADWARTCAAAHREDAVLLGGECVQCIYR
jgi:3-oxoacyl-[acyl-carrier protein] reductase